MTFINYTIYNKVEVLKTPESSTSDLPALVRRRRTGIVVKRLFDIVISSFLIVVILSWLTPIISLLILIDSRSPVFFRQQRVGRFGKLFYCLKFRTMYKNIEADFKQASDDDSRITRLGYFLRKTNIDELPQLFNVLLGQMSIVGPRPHMLKDCRDFNLVVKNYKLRTLVKPGITGLAQIKGFRGPTEDDLSIIHRYKWDLFYVRRVSLMLDISILITTIIETCAHFITNVLNLVRTRRTVSKDVRLQEKKQIAA
jgi:putative colanic acid biosysnthesis UDP-glucose lipid carrier transferase